MVEGLFGIQFGRFGTKLTECSTLDPSGVENPSSTCGFLAGVQMGDVAEMEMDLSMTSGEDR